MTVAELLVKLQGLPAGAEVVVWNGEYCTVKSVEQQYPSGRIELVLK